MDSGNQLLVIPVLSGHASNVGPKAVCWELDLGETLTPSGVMTTPGFWRDPATLLLVTVTPVSQPVVICPLR